jgi:hypothetical protein
MKTEKTNARMVYCGAVRRLRRAILPNRRSSPIESYNDLDGEVYNFFRVPRIEKEQLVEAIGLPPSPGSIGVSELVKLRV